jgi:hypothetical protein
MGRHAHAAGFREEAGQIAFLTRHFFDRLFRNEVVDFADQMKERLIAVLAVLAIVVFWVSEMLLFKYHFVPDVNVSWQEKAYVLTLVMILFGIITLLEWDVLFPDRQDFLNLMPLPVRLRTMFFGKLLSSVLFIGLFSVAMNIGSAVLFSMYLAPWRAEGNLLFGARYVGAHLAVAFAACAFVFFACVFLQFLLMAVLPRRLYRRLSLLLRGTLLAAFAFLLLAFFFEPGVLDDSFRSLPGLKESEAALFFRFPPLWFVGLYERLLGSPDPAFLPLARSAGLAILLALAGFVAASGLTYRRHVRKTLETERGSSRLAGVREAWEGLFGRAVLRAPEERAVYGFFSRTLRSSPKQRVHMVYYLAMAGAVIMLYLIINRQGFRDLSPGNTSLLAQPLVLIFVILAGLRSVVNIPASPKANWIFETTETGRTMLYVRGLKKALFFRWLVPLAGLVFASHLLIWPAGPSLRHAAFILVVAGLVLEGFFRHFRKVPFACSFVPGKFKFHVWGIPLTISFLAFLALVSRLERALLESGPAFVGFLTGAAGLWLAVHLANRRYYGRTPLLFEDEPEPAMVTLPDRT